MHAVERAIVRIGSRQDNVITRDQLLGAGLGRGAIAHRLQVGWMRRLHQAVYLIGPARPTPIARARAAVLACGAGAVLSDRAAAEMFGLLPATPGEVDVTVIGRNPHRQTGIRIHRVAQMPRRHVTTMRGMRTTSVARTICDLAATDSARDVELAFQEALYRRIVTDRALAAVIAREPRRQGAPVIRALLSDPRMTRSEMERALLKLIEEAQLPRPLTNVRRNGYLIDLLWPAEGLAIEFDGRDAHGHALAFDRDRKRDQVMLADGVRVMRVTGRHIRHEPVALVARIAQALKA